MEQGMPSLTFNLQDPLRLIHQPHLRNLAVRSSRVSLFLANNRNQRQYYQMEANLLEIVVDLWYDYVFFNSPPDDFLMVICSRLCSAGSASAE